VCVIAKIKGDQKCIHNFGGGICLGCGYLEGLGDGMVIQGLMKSIKTESLKEKYCTYRDGRSVPSK
jgi:hypothetical protein